MIEQYNPAPETWLLIDAACSGTITANQVRRLEAVLRDDQRACDLYLSYFGMHAELSRLTRLERCHTNILQLMSEPNTVTPAPTIGLAGGSCDTAPAVGAPAIGFLSTTLYNTIGYFSQGMPLAYLLATVVTGLGLLIGSLIHVSPPEQVARNSVPSVVVEAKLVGRITGMVDCKWEKKELGIRDWGLEKSSRTGNPTCQSLISNPQSLVSLGDKLTLASGLMEITYNTGAKVILQGPVTYEVEANGGYLSIGRLTGKLGKRSEGRGTRGEKSVLSSSFILHPSSFVIRTPTATVTDLGTEFGVEVTEEGATETQVFVGAVKVRASGGQDKGVKEQIVHAGSASRVDGNGDRPTAIQPGGQRFVRRMPQASAALSDAYAELVLSMKPFAYYRMEPPKDPKDKMVIFDSAPGGYHGRLYSANEIDDPWDIGRFGGALRLPGRDVANYADVKNLPGTDTDQLSVSVWVFSWHRDWWAKIASEPDWRHDGNIGPHQFHVGLYEWDGDVMAGVAQRNGLESRGTREGVPKPFPTGRWQHVAFVADGSFLHLYRNGVEVAASPCDGVYKVPPIKHLTIGCQNNAEVADPPELVRPACCWNGRIDELAIFYHALTAQQIRQLFAGRPSDPITTTPDNREKHVR